MSYCYLLEGENLEDIREDWREPADYIENE
jgi:hypothetical protein